MLQFEADGASNAALRVDTDNNGVGDGALLGHGLQQLSGTISTTGTTLALRLTADINGGGEEIAFDHFTLEGIVSNNPPTANDDSVGVNEDDGATDVTATLLSNDTDPDAGDILAISAIDDTGTTGQVLLVAGVVTYDPNGLFESLADGEMTTDTFDYTISDGNGGTDTATVTVTITGQNDDPTANDDTGAANEDGPAVTIDLTANDSDADATDDLEILSIGTGSTTGMVTINPDNDTVSNTIPTASLNRWQRVKRTPTRSPTPSPTAMAAPTRPRSRSPSTVKTMHRRPMTIREAPTRIRC